MVSGEDAGPCPSAPGDGPITAPDVAAELMRVAHQRELAQLRQYIDDLAEDHRTHLMEGDRCLAAVYTGPNAMPERLAQVCAATRHELRCLAQQGDWRPTDEPSHRTVAAGEGDLAAGPAVRWLPEVPLTLYLADDRLGVVARGDTDGVIVVYPGLLLTVLGELFEALWTRADPRAAGGLADQRDRLADLLLTGLTDQAIGHQLGVGPRTVQRRIAALMADLGADTRFQAGIQAALRAGVVPDPKQPGD